jgi:nitroreductase
MFKDLVKKTRSYRRYDNTYEIADEVLMDLIDTARLTASAANRQPIKYLISNKKEHNDKIFPCLGWAGYLQDWAGPTTKEQPSAYIILFTEMQFSPHLSFDPGIVAQTIMLAAADKDLGSCMIASVNKNKLKKVVNLALEYEVLLVIAIGKPNETIVLEDVGADGSIMYWRDENSTHYVPKRKLQDIVFYFEEKKKN